MRYLILANPRSRTKWLSEYLGCGHDLVLGCRSVEEFITKLHNSPGSVETSVALGWRLWRNLFPSAPFVIIHRPPFEVADSFQRLSYEPDLMFLHQQDLALHECMEKNPWTIASPFRDLEKVRVRREICDWTGTRFDMGRDVELARCNIQIDPVARRQVVLANRANFLAFNNDLARRLIALEYEPK